MDLKLRIHNFELGWFAQKPINNFFQLSLRNYIGTILVVQQWFKVLYSPTPSLHNVSHDNLENAFLFPLHRNSQPCVKLVDAGVEILAGNVAGPVYTYSVIIIFFCVRFLCRADFPPLISRRSNFSYNRVNRISLGSPIRSLIV